MRFLAAFAFISLAVANLAPAYGQVTERFSGPLDSPQITSAQRPRKSPKPRIRTIPTRDLNTALAEPDRIRLVSADRPQFERQEITGDRNVDPQMLAPQTSVAVIEPAAMEPGAMEPAVNIGPENLAMFRVPQESFNPQQAIIDANQYIYGDTSQDGLAFGFDNSRLYHPLEGPQLRLLGAPTVPSRLGACDCCDEWADFCRFKALDFRCGCGGLKATSGHLGLPWLGSGENCDRTTSPCKNKCQDCDQNGCRSCSKSP